VTAARPQENAGKEEAPLFPSRPKPRSLLTSKSWSRPPRITPGGQIGCYAARLRKRLAALPGLVPQKSPAPPQVVGLYLAACAAQEPLPGREPGSVRTIEQRLSAIGWMCAQNGQPLDRVDRHIREVMQGIRRKHGRPPEEKEAVLGEDVVRMVETLDRDLLRGPQCHGLDGVAGPQRRGTHGSCGEVRAYLHLYQDKT
jgi:hypothetical protein